jgi:hypothetical protein
MASNDIERSVLQRRDDPLRQTSARFASCAGLAFVILLFAVYYRSVGEAQLAITRLSRAVASARAFGGLRRATARRALPA